MASYHFSTVTGKREICTAKKTCKYGGEHYSTKTSGQESLKALAAKGDIQGYLKAKEAQSILQEGKVAVSQKQVLEDFKNTLPQYEMEDEQEFFETHRKAHKTVSINGSEFSLALSDKGGSYCTECLKFLPRGALSGSRASSVDCPHCGEKVQAVYAGVGIESNSWKYLYSDNVRKTRWFHTSTYPNWDEAMANASEENAPLVHLGTREAAMDRSIDIKEHPYGTHAANFGEPSYIYEIELDEDVEVSDYLLEDDGYTNAPQTTADAGNEKFNKYSPKGVTRYLNYYENPGSISLLANPKRFKVVNKQQL